MTQSIHHHTFENGLTLLAEEMPWLESAAFAFLIPCGAVHDPPERLGLSNLLCDMLERGSGDRDSRQFVEALERLGVDCNSSVSLSHTSFSGATLADNLLPAIELHADLLLRPWFPEDQVDEAQQVCFQELRATEDDLAHRTMERVRELQYPSPYGRSVQGCQEHIGAIKINDVVAQYQQQFEPSQVIISVAGKVNWDELKHHVERLFGDWKSKPNAEVVESESSETDAFIHHDSNQTHIAIAYPNVPYRDPDYYQARAAVGVLSDGMSSRLFTEVREKEGLCYTIYAALNTLRDRGAVLCYSATSAERAQETLDVTLRELVRLRDGIEENELKRLKARIKSGLIMQQESSVSRSVSMAVDWYHLGRVRSIHEVSDAVNTLTAESISEFLRRHPPGNFRIATLGPEQLVTPQ